LKFLLFLLKLNQMKYRIREYTVFEIQCEVITKTWFRREKSRWMDVTKDGKPFYPIADTSGLYENDILNIKEKLPPFSTLDEAKAQKEIFEKPIIYHY
jgi:hypothetical protein